MVIAALLAASLTYVPLVCGGKLPKTPEITTPYPINTPFKAIVAARRVGVAVYGKAIIQDEEPLTASSNTQGWRVTGTLRSASPGQVVLGGTMIAQVDRRTSRVISICHDK